MIVIGAVTVDTSDWPDSVDDNVTLWMLM